MPASPNYGRGVWLLNGQSGCNCMPALGESGTFVLMTYNLQIDFVTPLGSVMCFLCGWRSSGRVEKYFMLFDVLLDGLKQNELDSLLVPNYIRISCDNLPSLCNWGEARQEQRSCWAWYADTAGVYSVWKCFALVCNIFHHHNLQDTHCKR